MFALLGNWMQCQGLPAPQIFAAKRKFTKLLNLHMKKKNENMAKKSAVIEN